ncbi:unnamed protein product, partial [Polarella glacialis]
AAIRLEYFGGNTTLHVDSESCCSHRSSSSCRTGMWTSNPIAVSNGQNLAILVPGSYSVTAMALQLCPGGVSVSSSSLDRASFDQTYGPSQGFSALQWETETQ